MTTATTSPPQLLVVEDDRDLRDVLPSVLVEQGYCPSIAASLEQPLHLVHQYPFDLILTELLFPDPETLALILPLRELAHSAPVVVISTWLTTQAVQETIPFRG